MKKTNRVMKTILASLFVMSMVIFMNAVTVEAAPAKVTGLKQTSGKKDYVDIAWDVVNGSEITYVVEVSTDGKVWTEDSRTKDLDSCLIGLSAGSSYLVRVKAVSDYYSDDKRQDGPYSDIIDVVTAPEVSNHALAQINATSTSATVCWDQVQGATAYDVYLDYGSYDGEPLYIGTTDGTAVTISNLLPDISFIVYVYPKRVASTQFMAMGTYIYQTSIKTAPGKPIPIITDRDPRKKIGSSKNSNYNTLTVNYRYANDLDGDTDNADGYEINLYNAKGNKIQSIDNVNPYSVESTLKGVKTTATVFVEVVPYMLINNVKVYGEVSDRVLSVGTPTAKASKSGSGVKISWSKVANAKKYEVYMSTKTTPESFKKVKTVKANKKSVVLKKFKGKKFKKYTSYYYYVKAVGNYGGKKNVKSEPFYYNSFSIYTKYVY